MDGKSLTFTEPISSEQFAARAEELGVLGQRFLQNLEERTAEYREKIKEYSYGTYSTLHRGFYCPSVAGDIVVGNQSRGRIRKKVHAGDPSLSFRYGFSGPAQYQCERFAYDDEGLKAWNLQVYLPIPPDFPVQAMFQTGDHVLKNLYVTFERENGFLKGYTAFDVKDGKISADGGRKYMVRRKRRA